MLQNYHYFYLIINGMLSALSSHLATVAMSTIWQLCSTRLGACGVHANFHDKIISADLMTHDWTPIMCVSWIQEIVYVYPRQANEQTIFTTNIIVFFFVDDVMLFIFASTKMTYTMTAPVDKCIQFILFLTNLKCLIIISLGCNTLFKIK